LLATTGKLYLLEKNIWLNAASTYSQILVVSLDNCLLFFCPIGWQGSSWLVFNGFWPFHWIIVLNCISKLTIFHRKYCHFFMKPAKKHIKVLLSPLDWGLGHATRCIPIIQELRNMGCEVVLATSGAPAQLLAREFPDLETKLLEGYDIKYNAGSSLFGSILLQMPGILKTIKKEHRWLNKLLQHEKFDLVISDNRPGFWTKRAPSIYITHQLLIQSGKGKWLNHLLQKLHTSYIKKFSAVWVPDAEGIQNLAGELSNPAKQLVKPTYIGLLSRFEYDLSIKEEYDLLVLLSGPEPQRTMLEQKLLQELANYNGKTVLVRGLPASTNLLPHLPQHITSYNHLPAVDLQQKMLASKLILCRSGYTTLMDLLKLKRKAMLIPTPGQPEQEYLAACMYKQNYFPYLSQKEFVLQKALEAVKLFDYKNNFNNYSFHSYKKTLQQLVLKQDQ
jgi:predicted glycosyltransferase